MFDSNCWKKYSSSDEKKVMKFAEGYKKFLSNGKTERMVTKEAIKLLDERGFKNIELVESVKPGDKVYFINKNKNVCAFVIGRQNIENGLRILGAHIDSPRMDFKEKPFYSRGGFAYADTHYYGGIKKYQWVTIPLALHGVVCKKDGSTVEVHIGDDDKDPVFGISDLLIHLSADQLTKTANKVIEGENLDLILGNKPIYEKDEGFLKKNVLNILKDKYDIEEEDFISAEIEVVPAGKARDFGIDRSMIAGYGHDDRCCAYPSLMAVLDVEDPEYTSCCILVDKEEVGSIGATGAQSTFFENTIARLLALNGNKNPLWNAKVALENSKMLSSDVSAGYDPLFSSAFESNNTPYLSYGIVFNKYTGSRGKSGCNDANPEYIAWIRKILDDDKVNWQTGELGRVDQGGGGTIAYILGNYNMNVIDAGIPVLNMHAPMEVISKAVLYEAYRAYYLFLTK
jgi:aspartyl aminopeptidase